MSILERLFGKGDRNELLNVEEATAQPEVHEKNRELTQHLIKSQRDIRFIERKARSVKNQIDSAIAIAVASGSFNRR